MVGRMSREILGTPVERTAPGAEAGRGGHRRRPAAIRKHPDRHGVPVGGARRVRRLSLCADSGNDRVLRPRRSAQPEAPGPAGQSPPRYPGCCSPPATSSPCTTADPVPLLKAFPALPLSRDQGRHPRRRTVRPSAACSTDWDLIVIGQSAFTAINVSADIRVDYIEEFAAPTPLNALRTWHSICVSRRQRRRDEALARSIPW